MKPDLDTPAPITATSTPELEALRLHLAATDAPCPGCGYNLRGTSGGPCPECGAAPRLAVVGAPEGLAWSLVLWLLGCGACLGFGGMVLGYFAYMQFILPLLISIEWVAMLPLAAQLLLGAAGAPAAVVLHRRGARLGAWWRWGLVAAMWAAFVGLSVLFLAMN